MFNDIVSVKFHYWKYFAIRIVNIVSKVDGSSDPEALKGLQLLVEPVISYKFGIRPYKTANCVKNPTPYSTRAKTSTNTKTKKHNRKADRLLYSCMKNT